MDSNLQIILNLVLHLNAVRWISLHQISFEMEIYFTMISFQI